MNGKNFQKEVETLVIEKLVDKDHLPKISFTGLEDQEKEALLAHYILGFSINDMPSFLMNSHFERYHIITGALVIKLLECLCLSEYSSERYEKIYELGNMFISLCLKSIQEESNKCIENTFTAINQKQLMLNL